MEIISGTTPLALFFKKGLFLTVSAALTLSGCALLPGGVSPRSTPLDANTLSTGQAIRTAGEKLSTWPSQRWWQAYADPQLDLLVAEATAGNPALRIARARVARVRALSGIARSSLAPSIQAGAEFTREQFTENQFIPPPYAGNWAWNNLAMLDFAYDLDLWGKNRSALGAALDNVQMARAEAQEVRLALETAVVRVYVRLSLEYALMDIAKGTLRQRQDILDITRKRFAAGLATELDVSQAETALPAQRAEIEHISETIELLCNQLSALVGKGPGEGESIRRPALCLDLQIGLPAVLPADLLGRRPDVTAQRWRVEAAGKEIDSAKAAFYPDINLKAFAGWQSLGFAQFLSPGSLANGFGPAISLPIFEGGRLRSQLKVSTADYDMAVEAYNNTLIQALENVANQVVSLRSLKAQRVEADNSNTLAHHAYDIALGAFQAGLTDYLNVLNAQNQTLLEAQRKAQVEARLLDSYASLMQALGGGVPLEHPPVGTHP